MNKIIKEEIAQLKPSATLAINEESNRLINGPEEFGGLRKALIGSITGFKNLVMSEKT